MIKELLLAFVLLVSTKAFAQYQIPGGGSIPMPPGCEANFGYATYCVASGFIPRGFSGDYSTDALNMVWALESKYGQVIQHEGGWNAACKFSSGLTLPCGD